jgi:hypothetical protein
MREIIFLQVNFQNERLTLYSNSVYIVKLLKNKIVDKAYEKYTLFWNLGMPPFIA